ncbi:DUF2884 family protein [Thalassotalea ganghwensis]
MKTLLASTMLIATSSAMAHDTSFSTDNCHVSLEGGVSISKDAIEFTKDDKTVYKIVNDRELYISGQAIALSATEQDVVNQYSTSIRAVVPEVKDIALDAMDIAVDGVNLAFNELLGEGNDVGYQLTTELSQIKTEIETSFAQDKTITINEEGFDGEQFFGEDFEKRIETMVESTIQNSMGSLLIAVGQELLFAGGNMDAFETRMENFGEQIEYEMETRAKELEKRGEAICQSVLKIDELEEQLKGSIEALSDTDVLVVDKEESNAI